MKKTLFITLILLSSAAWSQDHPLSKEEIELERERIKLQREQLELERQKLEIERLKIERQNQPVTAPTAETPIKPKTTYTKELYLGVDYLLPSYGKRTTTLNGTENEYEAESRGYGVKFGFGTFDENRVEIAYSKVTLTLEEEETEWDVTMFSLDYLFVYHEAFGEKLSPFIKVGLTSASSDSLSETLDAMGYTTNSSQQISGLGLRLGIGLFYLLDERMELSFGIDSNGITWNDTTLQHAGGTDKLELHDSISTTYLTFNYRF